jgi:hypothetical protein
MDEKADDNGDDNGDDDDDDDDENSVARKTKIGGGVVYDSECKLTDARTIERYATADHSSKSDALRVLSVKQSRGVEVDLQTCQRTVQSSHLKALDSNLANDPDVIAVFGRQVMQGATIEATQNCKTIHLLGRNHNIAHWITLDKRPDLHEFDRDYNPVRFNADVCDVCVFFCFFVLYLNAHCVTCVVLLFLV